MTFDLNFADWAKTLAIWTALATIVQAVVATIMMRGLRHARTAAEAASATLQLMEDSSQKQLRAYVGLAKSEFSGFLANQPARLKMHLRNSGVTPAEKFKAGVELFIVSPGLVSSVSATELPPMQGTVMGATVTVYVQNQIPFAEWSLAWNDLLTGSAVFMAVVTYEYEDVFGEAWYQEIRMKCNDPANHEPGGHLIYDPA